MIERDLGTVLAEQARSYPVVTVTGPRQSGKTTLCRAVFPALDYVSLEAPDVRQFAREDPRGFLGQYRQGAIFDEVQHVPELMSYLQIEVDNDPAPGRFILTGSQHFALAEAIAQSLAGRTAVLELLPPSLGELRRFGTVPDDPFKVLYAGSYPRIHDRKLDPTRWLRDYTATYVQRDVRQVLDVSDLEAFTTFVRLCAGRTAQEVNLSALGADAGVSHNTARAWLSVLETGYLVLRLAAFHPGNVRKQIVKAPKLHFLDSGLACYLLGIRSADELRLHPLRGFLFESWVAAEVYKQLAHAGCAPRLFHYRETRGAEVDLVVDTGAHLLATDAKSGATVRPAFFTGLRRFAERLAEADDHRTVRCRIVYAGADEQRRTDIDVVPWNRIADIAWD